MGVGCKTSFNFAVCLKFFRNKRLEKTKPKKSLLSLCQVIQPFIPLSLSPILDCLYSGETLPKFLFLSNGKQFSFLCCIISY